VDDYVGDVAMDKDFARRETRYLVRRNAAVGATDPQILRRLKLGKFGEIIRLPAALPAAQIRLFDNSLSSRFMRPRSSSNRYREYTQRRGAEDAKVAEETE
jgi:hypothetical protein